MKLYKSLWYTMLVMSLGVAGYAICAYGFMPLGKFVHPDMKRVFNTHSVGIYLHVFASLIALAVGSLQFSSSLRAKKPRLHRWTGRIYLFFGVLIGGLSGLYMAQFAHGGIVSEVGFTLLALIWLYTGFMALYCILKGKVNEHRQWMVRNFSLTFGAVTLRIYLGLGFASGIPFNDFYPFLAWLSWVPNIILAEYWFNREQHQTLIN